MSAPHSPTSTADVSDPPQPKYKLGVKYVQGNTEHIKREVKTREVPQAGKRFMIQVDDNLGDLPGDDMTIPTLPPLKPGEDIPDNNSRLIVIYSRKKGSDGEWTTDFRITK